MGRSKKKEPQRRKEQELRQKKGANDSDAAAAERERVREAPITGCGAQRAESKGYSVHFISNAATNRETTSVSFLGVKNTKQQATYLQ